MSESKEGLQHPVELPPVPRSVPWEGVVIEAIGGTAGGLMGGLIGGFFCLLAVGGTWTAGVFVLGMLGGAAMGLVIPLGGGLTLPAEAGPLLRSIARRFRIL